MSISSLYSNVLANECEIKIIGLDPTTAAGGTVVNDNGKGQTFWANDTLVTSLTVWRVAEQDSHVIVGLRPYFFETDSTGAPDITRQLYLGEPLVVLDGDGINPIEFTWVFDPPVQLPRPGLYAFMVFQDPCWAFIDILVHSTPDGSSYPDGILWWTHRTPCTPIPWMSWSETGDLTFKMQFCSTHTTPIRRPTWGTLKQIYRD
jgi:hypothetical protein